MHIQEFLDNLCLGELSNLYLGEQGQVELSPLRRRKLIAYTNQGLKALCSRFQLVQKELIIRAKDRVSLYPLRPEHSMTNGTANLKFIDDRMCDAFKGGVIKILGVFNEMGMEFPINDHQRNDSLFTPTFDTLQITHPVEDQGYSVIYQALHPLIVDEDCGCQDFNLPPMLEEALMAFVAGKVYGHMNGEANKAVSQGHMATFEAKCLEAGTLDMSAESAVDSHNKAETKGFV